MSNKLKDQESLIEWKDVCIDGTETNYIISNNGMIANKNTKRIRKWQTTRDGYRKTTIRINNQPIKVYAHRLVAEAFIPNPDDKPEVIHLNGDKSNNNLNNLKWVTYNEHEIHLIRTGLERHYGNRESTKCAYTESQINLARKMLEDPMNRPIMVESITGIPRGVLYRIKSGRRLDYSKH